VPGDPERTSREARRRDGIPLDPTTWEGVLASAETLGISRADALAKAGVK
jgi:uncharacterized oxidoreductase